MCSRLFALCSNLSYESLVMLKVDVVMLLNICYLPSTFFPLDIELRLYDFKMDYGS